MQKIVPTIVWLAPLLAAGHALAGDFSGGYVGGDLGVNRSSTAGSMTTSAANAASYGFEGGYGWNVGSTFLGVEGFVDASQQATHAPATDYGSNAYGLGLKIGVPIDALMPYATLAYDRTRGTGTLSGFSAGSMQSGLGLMYKFAPSWSVEGEWSTTAPVMNDLKLRTNNFSFGLNYHFDSPGEKRSEANDKAK
jgi:hypothetical protein